MKAQEVGQRFRRILPTLSKFGEGRDVQLTAPYEIADKFAHDVFARSGVDSFEEDLERIRRHVQDVFQKWLEATSSSNSEKKRKDSAGLDMFERAAMLFAEPVEGIIVTPNVEEIKASFAYFKYPKRLFAISVAFRQLCEIKARASKGGMVPCTTDIDEMKTISAACVRALEKSYAG